jgi:hypothetical protein
MPEWIAAPARTARNKEARGWWRKWGALPIWNFDARAQFFRASADAGADVHRLFFAKSQQFCGLRRDRNFFKKPC